jgi:hypothetical protein
VSKYGFYGQARALWPYVLYTVLTSALVHFVMLVKIDLASPKSFGIWFKASSIVIEFSVSLGMLLQYVKDPRAPGRGPCKLAAHVM